MKAVEYLKEFPQTDYLTEDLIINRLFEEALELVKKRNCKYNSAIMSCYKEQFDKWKAICRKRPEFYVARFVKMLYEQQNWLYIIMNEHNMFDMKYGG